MLGTPVIEGGRSAVEISPKLYRAIEALAAERGQPITGPSDQAIREWLEEQEEEEDLQAMAEAEAEGRKPVPWDRVKAELSTGSDAGR